MILIDDILISDEILQEEFICDLSKCKGGCCVEGDCGAPLTHEEANLLPDIYPKIQHLLPESHQWVIESEGTHTLDSDFGFVTPAVNGGICAYGYYDEAGVVKCALEEAWQRGIIAFQKPISCHLFPIRVAKADGFEALNYEPRPKLCKPACKLGRKLKVPVYQFLKTPIVRKYGAEFYRALEAVAAHLQSLNTDDDDPSS